MERSTSLDKTSMLKRQFGLIPVNSRAIDADEDPIRNTCPGRVLRATIKTNLKQNNKSSEKICIKIRVTMSKFQEPVPC